MSKQIYVNLPVKDLKKSRRFFESMGYEFNPKFTNEKAGCLILGENHFVMLLTESMFSDFTKKPISDATKTTEVIIALDCESREEVDAIVGKAVAAGATIYRDADDSGYMYSRSFADPDGHQWEYLWMDMAAFAQKGEPAAQQA
ncbi:MAG: VOC family protein [Chitinophagaceae bacterium]